MTPTPPTGVSGHDELLLYAEENFTYTQIAQALKEDLENSINLELHAGSGDLAVRSLNGLQTSVFSFMAGNTNLNGVPPETLDKAVGIAEQALQGQQVAEEQEEAAAA